jgi:small subunit ribosomal protein S21
MDEKKPQPAWKKDGQQQQQQQGSKDHRSWNRGQRRDNRDKGRRQDGPPPERKAPVVGPLEVEVYNNDVGQALKVLKNKMSKDGVLAELKRRRHAEKPSEAKRRKHREALKRMRKSKGKSHRSGNWKRGDRSKVAESRPMPESQAEQAVMKDDTSDNK